jgi:hypothetical protein
MQFLFTDAVRVRLDTEPEESGRIRTPHSAGRLGSDYQSREEDLTAQINDEILETSLIELQNLRDIAEGGVTTQNLSAHKGILKTLAQLQKFRREILGVGEGSVVYYVLYPSVEALDDLWNMCESGQLSTMFHDSIAKRAFLRKHKIMKLTVHVKIHPEEYEECRKFLLAQGNCGRLKCAVVNHGFQLSCSNQQSSGPKATEE